MDFIINSSFIDMMIIFILFITIIVGYLKGFVYRGYDLAATVISLIVALYLSAPLSLMFKVYEVIGVGEIVGNVINRFIVFLILFCCLKLILFLIGLLVKPLLKKVIYTFKIFEQLDRLLGILASFIEGIMIIYLILIFIVLPIVPNGKENIEKTIVAKKILELVPVVNEKIESLDAISLLVNEGINYDSYNQDNLYYMALSLNKAYDSGILSKDKLNEVSNNYYQNISQIENPILLNEQEYNEVTKLLNRLDSSKIDINMILNKIIVSE